MIKFTPLFFLATMITTICTADTLIINRINKPTSVIMPQRGITQAQVLASFGEPVSRKNPVGNPPISIWVYKEFSVYFENKWVISSVVNKASKEELGPKKIK